MTNVWIYVTCEHLYPSKTKSQAGIQETIINFYKYLNII